MLKHMTDQQCLCVSPCQSNTTDAFIYVVRNNSPTIDSLLNGITTSSIITNLLYHPIHTSTPPISNILMIGIVTNNKKVVTESSLKYVSDVARRS